MAACSKMLKRNNLRSMSSYLCKSLYYGASGIGGRARLMAPSVNREDGGIPKKVDSSIEQQYHSRGFELTAARKKAPPTRTMRLS